MLKMTAPRDANKLFSDHLPAHHEVLPSDLLDGEDQLRAERRRLAGVHPELSSGPDGLSPDGGNDVSETEMLRVENADLRARIEELENSWAEHQREYENLLEEKSEVIRSLHLKIQETKENGGQHSEAHENREKEELLRFQQELEQERRQLQEDEEALMEQMREMELSMSRERAELARQRNDLQRLQAELNRELEMSSRDSGLRERLLALQRRQQEANSPKMQQPKPENKPGPSVSQKTPIPQKSNSSIFRRLFGSGNP